MILVTKMIIENKHSLQVLDLHIINNGDNPHQFAVAFDGWQTL